MERVTDREREREKEKYEIQWVTDKLERQSWKDDW